MRRIGLHFTVLFALALLLAITAPGRPKPVPDAVAAASAVAAAQTGAASQTGWVLLAAEVGPDGRPRNVVLHASSGHTLLDQAAQEAVSRLHPAAPAAGH